MNNSNNDNESPQSNNTECYIIDNKIIESPIELENTQSIISKILHGSDDEKENKTPEGFWNPYMNELKFITFT